MPEAEAGLSIHSLLDFAVFGLGVGGVLLTQWRSTIGVKNKVAMVEVVLSTKLQALASEASRVADQATKANERTRKIEVMCAKNHGTTLDHPE